MMNDDQPNVMFSTFIFRRCLCHVTVRSSSSYRGGYSGVLLEHEEKRVTGSAVAVQRDGTGT